MTEKRYKVVEISQSGHCCFEYTVVDTTKPVMFGTDNTQYICPKTRQPRFKAVCECFDVEDAVLICSALNREP